MNRFEELGIARNASASDIRKAYKNIARLLHPDRCRDEKLRRAAELQMIRLNETLDILIDPVKRKQYETELDAPPRLEPPPRAIVQQAYTAGRKETNLRHSFWCIMAGMAIASLFWALRDSEPTTRAAEQTPDTASAQSGAIENGDLALQGRLDKLEDRLRVLELKPAPEKAKGTASGKSSSIAGDWLYRAVAAPSESALSPKKRINLSISEQGGMLRGTYRSGYEIPGGAISALSSFRFDGRPSDGMISWNNGHGNTGAIQFRLLSANSLMARWWAYSQGGDSSDRSEAAIFHRVSETAN